MAKRLMPTIDLEDSDTVTIQFTRSHGKYQPGDRAGFEWSTAKILMNPGGKKRPAADFVDLSNETKKKYKVDQPKRGRPPKQ